MVKYEKITKNPTKFRRFFGITVDQFQKMLPLVEAAWEEKIVGNYKRKGRMPALSVADMVLLVLFYFRTYVTQEFVGEMFGLDASNVCRIIRKIEPILAEIMPIQKDKKLVPEEFVQYLMDENEGVSASVPVEDQQVCSAPQNELRADEDNDQEQKTKKIKTEKTKNSNNKKQKPNIEQEHVEGIKPEQAYKLSDSRQFLIIDATENVIERPKKNQEKFYSGKKKRHTVKTEMRVSQCGEIVHVSQTFPGAVHDFEVLKRGKPLPGDTLIRADSGYQGLQKLHKNAEIPFKKPKNRELNKKEKLYNTSLSKIRVKVENVFREIKIFRILSDRYRNKRLRFNIKFRIVAGLVNMKNGFVLA